MGAIKNANIVSMLHPTVCSFVSANETITKQKHCSVSQNSGTQGANTREESRNEVIREQARANHVSAVEQLTSRYGALISTLRAGMLVRCSVMRARRGLRVEKVP